MLDGGNGMVANHARTCIAHGFADFFFHGWSIAMDGAFPARRFLFAETAMVQPCISLVKKGRARFAEPGVGVVMSMAEDFHHLSDCFLFFFDACHD